MDGGLVVEPELERFIQEKQKDYDALLHESIIESSAEIDLKEQELALLRKSIEDCRVKRKAEEQRLHSLETLIEERSKALESKEKQLGSIQRELNFCCRDVDAKEGEFSAIQRLVEERKLELEGKEERLKSVETKIGECERVLQLKEEECNWQMETMHRVVSERDEVLKKMQREVEECDKDLGAKKARLCLIEGLIREREQELKTKETEFLNIQRDFEWKEEELRALSLKIVEFNKEIRAKEEELDAMQRLINGQGKELQFKRKNFLRSVQEKIDQLALELESNKKEFELVKKEKHLGEKEKVLESRMKQFEERMKEVESKEKQYGRQVNELKSKERQFEGRVKDLELKEKQFEGRAKELESKEKQIEGQMEELHSREKYFEGQVKELESEQKQFVRLVQELESKEKQFEGQVKEFESKQKHFEVQLKEFESKEKQFVGKVKAHELKENEFEAQMKKFESREKQYERRVQELDLKEKQFEGQMKDLESKKKQYEVQEKLLELKEVLNKMQPKELNSKEKQFEGPMKDLESNTKHFEQQVKVKYLKAKQNRLEGQPEELVLKEAQYISLINSLEEEKVLKEKSSILLHQVKSEPVYFTLANSVDKSTNLELLFDLLKKYELIRSQVSDALRTLADPTKLVLDTIKGFCPPQLGHQLVECDANILRRMCNILMDELKKSSPVISFHVKEEAMKLASDWKENIDIADMGCLEVLYFFKFIATYKIASSFNENELKGLLHEVAQHCQAPQIHGDIEKLSDNQLIPTTTDGGNLQLLSDEPELIKNDILANLQTASDPAQLVLDIIRKPIFPQNRKGNEAVIIGESHIVLIEQLMRISPHIKPCVREEAMKLALDLKENMGGSTENSLVVLGFLLLLSIYGLVSYFNEDEVLKLVEFAAQHKQAVELFRTLGFVDKIYDFVQNLIVKKQYIEAVRFICAYELADKFQPVNLLRQCMGRAKQMSINIGRKKRTAKKVRVRDKEIASLKAVLRCISDNNLESQDLVNEIRDLIRVLEKQKEDILRAASDSSKVEVQQPEEKKCSNEAVTTNNQVQQPKEKKCSNEAVSKNQAKLQQHDEKKPSDGTVTMNQVKVEQHELKKCSSEAVSVNQVKGEQHELKKCSSEAVSVNQVRQRRKKKRAIEAVPSKHQLGNNKRPRSAGTCSVPPVFTSYSEYQRAFVPRGMPAQFGFPTSYFGLPTNPLGAERFRNSGTNSFCHSGLRFPFR